MSTRHIPITARLPEQLVKYLDSTARYQNRSRNRQLRHIIEQDRARDDSKRPTARADSVSKAEVEGKNLRAATATMPLPK